MQTGKDRKRSLGTRPPIIVLATLVAGAVVFGPAVASGVATDILGLGAFVFGTGVMAGLMDRQGWALWWTALLTGYAVGLWNAWRLVPYAAHVPGAFDAALTAALIFTGLGFLLGMVAEFVRFLHTLTHNVRPKKGGKGPTHGQWTATTTN